MEPELRVGQYKPDLECKRCQGTGDPKNPKNPGMGCICTYIEERDFREMAAESLARVGKQLRVELEEQGVNHPMVRTPAMLLEFLARKRKREGRSK